jgi:hypothetical protein
MASFECPIKKIGFRYHAELASPNTCGHASIKKIGVKDHVTLAGKIISGWSITDPTTCKPNQ